MSIALNGLCPLLQVFDMPTSLAFYRDVLGFEVIDSDAPGDDCDWCWLRLNDCDLMLNTCYEKASRPPSQAPARKDAHQDTGLFFACKDLDAAFNHLRSHGVRVNPAVVREYGMSQLSFNDPDGYNLCLQWPVTEDSAAE